MPHGELQLNGPPAVTLKDGRQLETEWIQYRSMQINWATKGLVIDCPNLPQESDDLVLGNTRLALKIAGIFAKYYPRYKDDLLSVAFLTLVKVVRSNPDDLQNLLVRKIASACSTYLHKERFQIGSKNTKYRKGTVPLLKQLEPDLASVSSDIQDLKDFLLALADDPLEKTIIELRLQGFTDKEISEKAINLSRQWIHQLRKQLEGRYEIAIDRLNAKT